MITSQGKLRILEDFVVDRSLPKFKAGKRQNVFMGGDVVNMSEEEFEESMGESSPIVWRQASLNSGSVIVNGSFVTDAPTPFWVRLWRAFFPLKPAGRKVPEKHVPTVSVLEFFSSVKNSAQELRLVEERSLGYERALAAARRNGQVALRERLEEGMAAYRAEAQAESMGLKKFVSEEDIVGFYKQSDRGLRLDMIANFTRQIPDDVAQRKARADELHIFDNYAVLHYDPEAKSFAETEKEKEARKDPILFGLLKGRRQLYFVGDWVDEVCDLTLDQIADKLGKEVVKETPSAEVR